MILVRKFDPVATPVATFEVRTTESRWFLASPLLVMFERIFAMHARDSWVVQVSRGAARLLIDDAPVRSVLLSAPRLPERWLTTDDASDADPLSEKQLAGGHQQRQIVGAASVLTVVRMRFGCENVRIDGLISKGDARRRNG